LLGADRALDDHAAAEPEHPGDRREGEEGDHGGEPAARERAADEQAEGALERAAVAADLEVLAGERLDGLDRREPLLQRPGGARELVLGLAADLADDAAPVVRGDHQRRHDRQHRGGQQPVHVEQDRHAADQHQHVAQEDAEVLADGVLQAGDVVGEARQQLAGAGLWK
jgi:hypothetical protein